MVFCNPLSESWIQGKLRERGEQYSSLPHQCLKIKAILLNGLIPSFRLAFDEILCQLVLSDVFADDLYSLCDWAEDVFPIPLPLRPLGKELKFWSCSQAFYCKREEHDAFIRKFLDTFYVDRIDFAGHIPKVAIDSGHYKQCNEKFYYVLTSEVTWYACGNRSELERLLIGLESLGSQTCRGWGQVGKIQIEETKQDYSLIKDGKLMRNLPVAEANDLFTFVRGDVKVCPYRPPYRSLKSKTACYVWGSRARPRWVTLMNPKGFPRISP